MSTLLAVAALALTACGSADTSPATEAATAPTTTTAAQRPDLTPAQTDTVFLQMLDSYRIDYGHDRAAAIGMAHSICRGLGRGLSQTDLLPALMDKGPGYTLEQATNYLNTSIVAYCPDQG